MATSNRSPKPGDQTATQAGTKVGADVTLVGSTDSSGNPAGNVTAEITTWSYGTWPHYLYSFDSATTTVAAALTINNVQAYKTAIVVISGLTAETVTITGTNGSGNSQALLQADGTTATTTLGNGTYYLDRLVCTDLVFTKSAAVESVTIDVDLKAV